MITIGLPAFIVAWLYGRKKLLGMIFGFMLAVSPVVFWYAAEGALDSIWEVYIQYNATYAAKAGRGTIFTLAFWPVLFVAVANGYAALREREAFTRRVLVINLFYLLFSWGVILLSGGGVRYYCPIMPSLVLPMIWVILEFKKKVAPQRFWRGAITLCGMCVFVVAGGTVWRNMGMRDVRESYAELRRIGKVIQDRSSVTVLGCDCYAYLVLGAMCPGRFPFQGTIAGRSEKYREEMIRDLRSARSRYLVVPKAVLETPGELGVVWAKEPILERYRVVASCRGYDIYDANGNDKE